jgi:glutamate synthase (NADPH/NADH) small chain
MAKPQIIEGIAAQRLPADQYAENFADAHPPLDAHEALVEADRCYFCYDAPCVTACPTSIDIPKFIRQISTGNLNGSAKTIFDQNILGGMCARVCPTETLCEQACVREVAEGQPVKIGLLQRYATDGAMRDNRQFYERAAPTGRKIAVVGAGPAGLACAHRLAMYGHDVVVLDAQPKAGGLNEYGIAAYKSTDDFAQAEVDYVTAIGGIEIRQQQALGATVTLDALCADYDAVFLGIGLGGVNRLGLADEDATGVVDATRYIAELRQAADLANLPVGRRVLVIGGGMTAIDIAAQTKLLGAEEVTIAYRRGREDMNASALEQQQAANKGVIIRHWVQPKTIETDADGVSAVTLEYTENRDGRLVGTGDMITLQVDQLFRAIGQQLADDEALASLSMEAGRIRVNAQGQTSIAGVWAGGDCATGGDDLTVTAVAEGRDAAEAIHAALS